jgi:phosphoglucan,water dikinase
METALTSDSTRWKEYQELVSSIDSTPSESLPAVAESIRELIDQISVPNEIPSAVEKEFDQEARLMVRSSANCEDLEKMSGAGLYDSVANVVPKDVSASVLAVWASLWTRRAALSRKAAGIPQDKAHMAVLIQQMVDPDYSFVLHTLNPINHNPREIYAEIAVGLGETLVSAASRGTPYRFVCDKESGSATIVAFANFSRALRAGPDGNVLRTLDYSTIALSRDAEARKRLGSRLAKVGQFVENALKKPQDIEGAVVGDKLYLVQSRPQQGLRGT